MYPKRENVTSLKQQYYAYATQNYRATLDIAPIYLGYTNDLATTFQRPCYKIAKYAPLSSKNSCHSAWYLNPHIQKIAGTRRKKCGCVYQQNALEKRYYSIGGSQKCRAISTCPLDLKCTPSSSSRVRWRLQPGAVRPSLLTTRWQGRFSAPGVYLNVLPTIREWLGQPAKAAICP